LDKKRQVLEDDLTNADERCKCLIKELAARDEEHVVMKVDIATLQEKVKSRFDEVSKFGKLQKSRFIW
jgi:predicted  nucleic acid-binding Zn-ribbon protein